MKSSASVLSFSASAVFPAAGAAVASPAGAAGVASSARSDPPITREAETTAAERIRADQVDSWSITPPEMFGTELAPSTGVTGTPGVCSQCKRLDALLPRHSQDRAAKYATQPYYRPIMNPPPPTVKGIAPRYNGPAPPGTQHDPAMA